MPEQRAKFGIVKVVAVIATVVFFVVFLYPVFTQSPAIEGIRMSTLGNIHLQALAVAMYSTDYDDRLPPAPTWMDSLETYVNNDMVFQDVDFEGRKDDEYGCAFFRPLSFVDFVEVEHPETVPLTFQSSDFSRNANGGLDLLPGRIKGVVNYVSFLDFHAEAMPKGWPRGPITIVLKEPEQ